MFSIHHSYWDLGCDQLLTELCSGFILKKKVLHIVIAFLKSDISCPIHVSSKKEIIAHNGKALYGLPFSLAFCSLNLTIHSSALSVGRTKMRTTWSTTSTLPVLNTLSKDAFLPILSSPPSLVST